MPPRQVMPPKPKPKPKVKVMLSLPKVFARLSLSFTACALLATAAAQAPRANHTSAPLTERELALQMLNRFTFGPRPGDLDAVMKMGPEAWFAQQLNAAAIPDPALDNRMQQYPSLYLPPSELLVQFPSNQVIRKIADGQRPYPPDPMLAAAYEVLVAKYNRRQQKEKAQAEASAPPPAAPGTASSPGTVAPPATSPAPGTPSAPAKSSAAAPAAVSPSDDDPVTRRQQQQAAQVLADQVLAFPRDQRMQAIVRLPVDQRITLTQFVPDPQRSLLLNDFTPRQKELFYLMAGGPDGTRVIDSEFQQAKVLRAVLSERQLLEVMTDFWYNHFNVDIRKEATQWYAPTYERDAIRAHALGKFSDLLLATAQSPAMLYYLDNWSSIGPDSQAAGRGKKQRGLNENYGREVMELHTVGVNAGYTQADVTNLAKILTGWTIDQPQQGGGFIFDPRKHQPGAIQWFGQKIQDSPDGGYDEGRRALLWLAAQPQTARHISYQLAQRFIADDPPPALVDRMTQVYLSTGGDIAEILRTMVRSPEFLSRRYYRVKVKTPLEFVASVFRATDTNPSNPNALVATIARMGEPLYQMQPPTGYSTTADHWMNSGALVDRLNFSLQFAQGKLGGIRFDAPRLLAQGLLAEPATAPQRSGSHAQPVSLSSSGRPSGEEQALSLLERMLTDGQISPRTDQVIHHELEAQPDAAPQPAPQADPDQTLDTMTALILGSPEFQMH
jgi:uncharacterized protein (DUF1800 family)